jgi:hypothetical protein
VSHRALLLLLSFPLPLSSNHQVGVLKDVGELAQHGGGGLDSAGVRGLKTAGVAERIE